MSPQRKPKVAIFKFASCDGCQLSLLDAEDELLAVTELIDLAHFAEASSDLNPGPYDISIVEGSVTTSEDAERIQKIRADSRFLMTIGACATAGGIQSLRNWASLDDWVGRVYPSPDYIQALATSTPIATHVHVDFELHGCPVNHRQLVEVIVSLAEGRRPRPASHSVCLDCKLRGTVCHIVTKGAPCLGPVTHTGCNAICPAFNRGCFGCYGPSVPAPVEPLLTQFRNQGHSSDHLVQLLRSYNAQAPHFREAADAMVAEAAATRPRGTGEIP